MDGGQIEIPGGGAAPTPEQIMTTVVQDTIAITKQTPVSTDGYVMLALNTDIPKATRIIVTGAQSQDPAFIMTAQSKLLIVPKYLYGNSVLKLTDATIVAEPELHVMPNGNITSHGTPAGAFCYNGGGIGAHKQYQNAAGDTWIIHDIGAEAATWPLVEWNASEGAIVNNPGVPGGGNFIVPDAVGRNAVGVRSNSDVSNEPLYVATSGSPADAVLQETGSDITFKPYDPTNPQGNNPLEQFWLQIYYNTNPATPVYKRFEHNAGGGMLPFPVAVDLLTSDLTGVQKLLGQIVVWPNVTAAADGMPVRDSSGFIADIAATTTLGLDPTFAPNSLTKL